MHSNVLVPRQLGIVVNSLGVGSGQSAFVALSIYIVLSWASSSAGLLGLKKWLFVPIRLNARRAIRTASYNHIMELSCDFHDSKRSGEIYQAIWQGESVLDLMETLSFKLLPVIIDLVVACVYLYTLFDIYMFLIAVVTMILYFWVSASSTARQADAYCQNVKYSRKEYQLMCDTIGGWKTILYFNRFEHTKEEYSAATAQHTALEIKAYLYKWLASTIQDCVLDISLFAAGFYAIYQVVCGNRSVGYLITLLNYWSSLVSKSLPLQTPKLQPSRLSFVLEYFR